jgi:hypothetical protein
MHAPLSDVQDPTDAAAPLHPPRYQEIKDPSKTLYIIPDEQTDNDVSPWETHLSSSHKFWKSKHPDLAAIKNPRVGRRLLLHPEAEPESMALDPAMTRSALATQTPTSLLTTTLACAACDTSRAVSQCSGAPLPAEDKSAEELEQEACKRVLKRLCSNEATRLFWHPVDESEMQYYKEIGEPICLSQIAETFEKGEYETYSQFHADVSLMVSNAMQFNEESTSQYIQGACLDRTNVCAY